METIKTENKIESKKENKNTLSRAKFEEINLSLSCALLKIKLVAEHLDFNRDDDIAYGLLFDAVKELEHSVSSSVNYEKQLCL